MLYIVHHKQKRQVILTWRFFMDKRVFNTFPKHKLDYVLGIAPAMTGVDDVTPAF